MKQKDELMEAAEGLNSLVQQFRRDSKILMRLIMHRVQQVQGKKLVRIGEAAELLEVSERTVQRMADRGELTRYNEDGTRKVDSSRTNTFYNFDEIFMVACDT